MTTSLDLVLILLASAVFVVVLCRFLHLPPLLGYLIVGIAIGPNALGWIGDTPGTRHLAEFGVVFLMFSIGLEFSLPKLFQMRRTVFGFGLAQVALSLGAVILACIVAGINWKVGIVLGGAFAMSSTAIVVRMLSERMELDSPHGRQVLGVLLFQDLAVIPFLIMIPALAQGEGQLAEKLMFALLKAALVLSVLLFLGDKLMRAWFYIVARRRSHELFVLNVLLITLGVAYATERAGLSLALGAFVAGMLIAETEFRHRVEDDIKPFRDVLLGLFFVTMGMQLDLAVVSGNLWLVGALFVIPVLLKFGLIALLARLFGSPPGTALRAGFALAQVGEFGLVLLTLAGEQSLLGPRETSIFIAAMLLSMMVSPVLIHFSDALVLRLSSTEWMLRSLQVHHIAVQSIATEGHVLICGYGRTGQRLAHLFEQERVSCIALDLDPERVREAAAAGERVVYGDSSRREALVAAGITRARAMVISFADTDAALRVLRHARELNPALPVIVRTFDDARLDELMAAGAAEVVPETFESSLMLASHALVLVGVPLKRVLRRIRDVRDDRYSLLRGFFHGESDAAAYPDEAREPRLRSISVSGSAYARGLTLSELQLDSLGVSVSVVRRRESRMADPPPETRLEEGDVVVLVGQPDDLAAAERRLLQRRA